MQRTRMTMVEVAQMLPAPIDTLRYWRKRGEGPRSYRLGRRVVYDLADVEQWINEQRDADRATHNRTA